MIEIDGNYLEAGGQILRTATALAAIKKIPCRVFNIRKKRPNPGLATQHLLGLQALAKLCNGELEGDFLGSEEIKFYPGENYQDRISINIPTAGSIALILQTLIPPALFAPHSVEILFNGGATDTFFSPTIDYFHYVFLPILEKMIKQVEINPHTERGQVPHQKLVGDKINEVSPHCGVGVNIPRRGYYPEGGARIEVKVSPSKLKNLNLTERGSLKKIVVISGASNALKEKRVAERQIAGVREVLGKLKLPTEEKIEYYDSRCPGSQICLIAEFEKTIIGTDNLGKLGKRAEDVGKEAALDLLKEQKSEACLDKHLADQILPYLALAPRKSQVTVSEITNHCKTNIWVIEKFIDGKFEIRDNLILWTPPTHRPPR